MRDILAELLGNEQAKRGANNPNKGKHMRHTQKQLPHRCDLRRNTTLAKMQIRIALFMSLSLCLLSGCQQPPPQPYGNFAEVESADLVRDAANALHSSYPPAKTSLVLLQPAEDAFGLALVESLRNAGYAVAEYAPPEKGGTPLVSADAGFAYIIEKLRDGGGLRLTLHIGDGVLSRMYRIKRSGDTEQYIPKGFWTRKQ